MDAGLGSLSLLLFKRFLGGVDMSSVTAMGGSTASFNFI